MERQVGSFFEPKSGGFAAPSWRAMERGLLACVVLILAGCSFQPSFIRPKPPIPDAYKAGADLPKISAPPSRWWESFGSEELNGLIDTALAENRDLKAAMARIEQSEALAGVAAGTLLPSLQGASKAQTTSPSGGQGSRLKAAEDRYARLYSLGLTASYELDLWGKNRSAMEAALATAQASIYDAEVVAATLISDVATGYFQYIGACDRVSVAEENVENMRRVLKTVQRRIAIGEGNNLELMQQRTILSQAEATLPVLKQSRDQSQNRLAILLGKPPQTFSLPCRKLESLKIPEVQPGLPFELLLRRPDLRKAEANLKAANANIGVARAKLLPSISLTAERGVGNNYLSNLFSPLNLYSALAGSIAATIFDNGKIQSEIEFSEARKRELIEAYQQAALASLRDVEDALTAISSIAEQVRAQESALETAREAHRLSDKSYLIGMTDYLNVLETERTQLKTEDDLVQARMGRLVASVSLYKALGGGTELSGGE
jgi:multidrug efflux system outer membrane protein